MAAHTSNNAHQSTNSQRATRRQSPVLSGVQAWKRLLAEEEQRCERTGFQAGIISIDHGPTNGDRDRTAVLVGALTEVLEFTDRACILNDEEIAVLMMPVGEVGATERLANRINASLRARGISAAIGFALRRSDGAGLSGTAARADACAAIAHSRKLRLRA